MYIKKTLPKNWHCSFSRIIQNKTILDIITFIIIIIILNLVFCRLLDKKTSLFMLFYTLFGIKNGFPAVIVSLFEEIFFI